MQSAVTITGTYDYRLVAVSVLIAIVAAYAALDLSSRIATAAGSARFVWIACGGVAMGTGIWAMHYVGMAALKLSVAVLYDWPTVLLSALVAVASATFALFLVSRPRLDQPAVIGGSIVMGGGIAAMHFIGMAAMRMPAVATHSAWLVAASILLAIGASYAALRTQFALRNHVASWSRRKFVSAILLGAAIPLMHYVGMEGMTFTRDDGMRQNLGHALFLSPLGLVRIIFLTAMALAAVIVMSIFDRRRARNIQELAESRAQLQSIFDHMADGIAVLDLEGNVIQANQVAKTMLGITFAQDSLDALRDNVQISLPNGVPLPRDQWPLALAIRGIFVSRQELMVSRQDTGQGFVAEINTTPIRNLAGQVIQIIVSHRDITERILNTETRSRLAAIVDSSEDAIIGKDINGIIRSWNAAAEKIFGYSAEEMVGQSILRLLPADRQGEESDFLSNLRRGQIIDHVETVRKTKSGKLIHISLTISPIRDGQGQIIGASKIARDITDRKQLERQLQQGQKMEAIGQLTGGIAHDFNNLLGVIIGNLGLLERLITDRPDATKRLATAHKAALRGADLTKRLLAFSSNEELKPAHTFLAEAIHNTTEFAARTLGPEIKIVTRIAENMPPVFVDPAALESALLNLMVNSRDAMPKGGTLTVLAELADIEAGFAPVKTGEMKAGRYACVSITDTGTGMPREILERALEPFYTTKPRGKGTGLGLAMVYGFVKQSGGVVRLYSEVGYGTTVTFYLQLADSITAPPKFVLPADIAATSGGKVLIVDDEADLLEVAATYLSDMGYVVFQATNGALALEIVKREGDIDLVVTDVIMPGGMNGVELVQAIRTFDPHIKVIYSSGFPADALSERSGTVVDGLLLRKPYQRAEFDAIVRSTLHPSKTPAAQASPQTHH